jgi:hypothetical protein
MNPGIADEGFNSIDSTIVFFDGPGDRTVRPCPPEMVPILRAIKDKMARDIAEFGEWPPSAAKGPSPNGDQS